MSKYLIKLVDAIFNDYSRTIKYSGFGYNLEMTTSGNGYEIVPKIEPADQVYGCKITVTDDGKHALCRLLNFVLMKLEKFNEA